MPHRFLSQHSTQVNRTSGAHSQIGVPGSGLRSQAATLGQMARAPTAGLSPPSPGLGQARTRPDYYEASHSSHHYLPPVSPPPGFLPAPGIPIHGALPDFASRVNPSPGPTSRRHEIPSGLSSGGAFVKPGERVVHFPTGPPEERPYNVGGYTDMPQVSQFSPEQSVDSSLVLKEIVNELKGNEDSLSATMGDLRSNQSPSSTSVYYATYEVLARTMCACAQTR